MIGSVGSRRFPGFLRYLGVATGLSVAGLLLARRYCTVVTVRGHSMRPTLADGQRVLAVRRSRYRNGDVIVFWTPEGSGTPGDPDYRIKRVIATGGEPRPEAFAGSALAAVVPAGQLAVAGDNAERSQDSRHLGYISLSDVRGRVRLPRG
ncbi:MAG TPA: S26 family signal peptidase [Jatrophihabitans sp.]|nr:S26 family signal peptidase [Jatrophihabitans sp.]